MLIARDDCHTVIVSECLTINQDVEVISEDTDFLLLKYLCFTISARSDQSNKL